MDKVRGKKSLNIDLFRTPIQCFCFSSKPSMMMYSPEIYILIRVRTLTTLTFVQSLRVYEENKRSKQASLPAPIPSPPPQKKKKKPKQNKKQTLNQPINQPNIPPRNKKKIKNRKQQQTTNKQQSTTTATSTTKLKKTDSDICRWIAENHTCLVSHNHCARETTSLL